jgi:hypothetical protein
MPKAQELDHQALMAAPLARTRYQKQVSASSPHAMVRGGGPDSCSRTVHPPSKRVQLGIREDQRTRISHDGGGRLLRLL